MRKFHITAGFISLVLALAISLPAFGQASAPSSSPQNDPAAAQQSPSAPATAAPSQGTPSQNEPAPAQPGQTDPSQAPASQGPSTQAQPAESTPSQPGASSQSGTGASASQGQTQSHTQTNSAEDNPLNLTDEQKTKLRPIVADENQQLDAVRNDASMSPEQKVQKANQIREVATPKIKAILTPEQLQKLAEMQQHARQQQQGNAPSSDSQKPQQ
jgi:periplasmic protein CpxP/Spy